MQRTKTGLHPRNRHQGRYDFDLLVRSSPELGPFVTKNRYGDWSVDFADPRAVQALNRALLAQFYGIKKWEIPTGYLCPPIPGRADYIHHIADLVGRGPGLRVLDIGVGANCIYPIIGHCEYGWSFVGVDIDAKAIASAQAIVDSNTVLKGAIELRLQPNSAHVLSGVVTAGEKFDLVICNPPFHGSAVEATQASTRKRRGLGRETAENRSQLPVSNFGGQGREIWCPGGEAAFVRRMVDESVELGGRIRWFSTLVSKEANLVGIHAALERVRAFDTRVIAMGQGQKFSRIVAWTFQ